MDTDFRTILVIAGAVVIIGILLDGFRRMRRARQDALRIDVRNDFQFPDDDMSAELPNGGARVISNRTDDEISDAADQFREQLDNLPPMSALDEYEQAAEEALPEEVRESLHEERVYAGEPDFQTESYQHGEAGDDPEKSGEAASYEYNEEPSQENMQEEEVFPPVSDDGPTETDPAVTDPATAAALETYHELDSAPESILPKAKPLNLDEQVPVLTDVEELGEEHAPAENVQDDYSEYGEITEHVELTAADAPGIRESVEGISDLMNPAAEAHSDSGVQTDVPTPDEVMTQTVQSPVKSPGPGAESLANRPDPNVVLVTHVVPHSEAGFSGEDILYLVNTCDLRHGEKGIFHRFEKEHGEGKVQFSMANSFNPGTFNPQTLAQDSVHGVSLFMSLPGPDKAMDAFEAMTEMASVIARNLGGEVQDETHSVMALQTIEHNRQQVRDFVRKQKLAGRK